jgi:ankyrin repeat protein
VQININQITYEGTPLLVAIVKDKPEIVKYLLEIGVDFKSTFGEICNAYGDDDNDLDRFNLEFEEDHTHLHAAIECENLQMMRLLVEKGFTVDII